MSAAWTSVTKGTPCPLCEATDWCRFSDDGAVTCRLTEAPAGWQKVNDTKDGRGVYVRHDARRNGRPAWPKPCREDRPTADWAAEHRRLRAQLACEQLEDLARDLRVRADALAELEPGWATAEDLCGLSVGFANESEYPMGAYVFPERSSTGRTTGLAFRSADNGRKGFARGATRGLTIPTGLKLDEHPVLIVEGPSDVAAARSLGLMAVGRPSNTGGADLLAEFLDGRYVLVLGERDEDPARPARGWPGRDGAVKISETLACTWRCPVRWALPPAGAKDARSWLMARVDGGLDLTDPAACREVGEELLEAIAATSENVEPSLTIRLKRHTHGKTIATLAVAGERDEIDADGVVFTEQLRLAVGEDRDAWIAHAVLAAGERTPWLGERAGERIRGLMEDSVRQAAAEALKHDGEDVRSVADAILGTVEGADLFRGASDARGYMTIETAGIWKTFRVRSRACETAVRRAYYEAAQHAPGAEAVSAALNMLEARATFGASVRIVAVRSAEGPDGALYLDLANDAGEYVVVTAEGWEIRRAGPDDPVRFWQPHGVRSLPRPVRGGSLDELRVLVNVQDAEWPLVIAWLVAALRPGRAFAVLIIFGEQGSGKSTFCRMLRRLIDPNGAELRAKPREERDLAIAARNGLVVAFDNLSGLSPELSDALARLATGGGFGTRTLHTDADEELFDATRPILVNGIDVAASRADLLDRGLLVRLPAIPEDKRQDEDALWVRFAELHPRLLGAVLDAVSCALGRLAEVSLGRLPRMASFARWAVAAEPALGLEEGAFLTAYEANRQDAGGVAFEGSPIAAAVEALLDERGGSWGPGSTSDLLQDLDATAGDAISRRKTWPKSVQALTSALASAEPTLRRERGILVERGKASDSTRRRWVRLFLAPTPDELPGQRGPSSDPSSGPVSPRTGPHNPAKAHSSWGPDDPDVPDEGLRGSPGKTRWKVAAHACDAGEYPEGHTHADSTSPGRSSSREVCKASSGSSGTSDAEQNRPSGPREVGSDPDEGPAGRGGTSEASSEVEGDVEVPAACAGIVADELHVPPPMAAVLPEGADPTRAPAGWTYVQKGKLARCWIGPNGELAAPPQRSGQEASQ